MDATPQYIKIHCGYTAQHGQISKPLFWAKEESKEFVLYDYTRATSEKTNLITVTESRCVVLGWWCWNEWEWVGKDTREVHEVMEMYVLLVVVIIQMYKFAKFLSTVTSLHGFYYYSCTLTKKEQEAA